jgi:hypothetical protein
MRKTETRKKSKMKFFSNNITARRVLFDHMKKTKGKAKFICFAPILLFLNRVLSGRCKFLVSVDCFEREALNH